MTSPLTFFDTFRFQNPWVFLLLFLLPFLYRFWLKQNRPSSFRYSLPLPVSIQKNPLKWGLFLKLLSLIGMIVALARPQSGFLDIERYQNGIEIMLLMDVSYSMEAEDLADQSRIEVAKQTLSQFIQSRSQDRMGLIMFSGEPLILAPPTLDSGLLLSALHQASIGVLKDGTAIGDALSLAVSSLKHSSVKSKVIILLTDGDNNMGQIDPQTAGELARNLNIRVYSIAIGKEGRVKIPIRIQNAFGKTITRYQWLENSLNPKLLKEISEKTSGKFYRVTDAHALDSVFQEIDQLEKDKLQSKEKVRYQDQFQWPLKCAFLIFLLGQILERWGWRLLP